MTAFETRFKRYRDEFDWLYMELYHDRESLETLKNELRALDEARLPALKRLDAAREKDPLWYMRPKRLGLTLYTQLFSKDLKGLIDKIPYLKALGINYLHLMPLLKMPATNNDGGYAVEDFGEVDPSIGSNADLEALTTHLRKAGISLCLDFVINHTASTHSWAEKAKAGDPEYQNYYHVFEDDRIPRRYEETLPEVFPATAPGNFTFDPKMNKWVMTTFYPFQWDLNYSNPKVFGEMVLAMLRLCNRGVEVIRVDAVPYIWKEIGTSCRNHPKVHTIMRLIRILTDSLCPSVLIKGEVVMAPKELKAYFGTPEKPECHLLYNVSGMVNCWSALAAQDVRLFKAQLDSLHSLPLNCGFVNYLRCHDDIGWGLDEAEEERLGIDPLQHKKYLYRFFEGSFPGSYSKGTLYNYDEKTGDARSCGTTASLCGLETAQNAKETDMAIQRNLMMHAVMMTLRGFPMINSGDEIAQLNDWSYLKDDKRREDSRNLHRSVFNWENSEKINKRGTIEGKLWKGLKDLRLKRAKTPCFEPEAWVSTWDSHNHKLLALVRRFEGEELIGLFNFSEGQELARLDALSGRFVDLFSGRVFSIQEGIELEPYQYLWLRREGN